MNIIVVISDSMRRDHLPIYGNPIVSAPNLQRLADQSLVFENCFPASFPTVPARADIMTGRYTFTYRKWEPLAQSERTLQEVLSEAGYLTCGISDVPFLVRNGYGYDRGFHDFYWIKGQRYGIEKAEADFDRQSEEDYSSPKTFRTAMQWLDRHHDEKFFLYVDAWDPHEPWDAPAKYTEPYYPEYQGENIFPCYWDWKEKGLSEKEIEIAHACYCGEITMVDHWFGKFLDKVDELDLRSSTAIIFFSDHGHYFGEHGFFGKSRFKGYDPFPTADVVGGAKYRSPLHQEITRVPLCVSIPGVTPARLDSLVCLPDITPTILDMAGEDIPSSVQASSLSPLLSGKTKTVNELLVTSASLLHTIGHLPRTFEDAVREVVEISPSTITNGDWDLLYAAKGEQVQLYRTMEDPGHLDNVFEANRGIAKELHQQFYTWLKQVDTPPDLINMREDL